MTSTLRRIFPYIVDFILINVSVILAYYLRYGRQMPVSQLEIYAGMAFVVVLVKIVTYHIMGLYKPMWRYAGFDEILSIFFAVVISNVIIIVYIYLNGLTSVPRSIYVIAACLDFLLIGGSRFYRQIFIRLRFPVFSNALRVMIIGAGETGGSLIREFRDNPSKGMLPVCIIDKDGTKKGRRINGIPIIGGYGDIITATQNKNVDLIIIAAPSITKTDLTDVISECNKTKCRLKIADDTVKDINKDIRDVDIGDLLGRDEVVFENGMAKGLIEGKTVLVTGGGGFIGSELSRQIGELNPKRIVIADMLENNILEIANELERLYPSLDVAQVVVNIREAERVNEVFMEYRPDVVFHTAAHKHVYLMELNPQEAVKNNIFGTLNVAKAADMSGVKRFVFVSTDKAVNPTNVYGATKRVCEMIIQAMNTVSKTEFTAVRFGNVLGATGTVIPIFRKQIEAGGPVTVRHREVIRYYMTVQEASKLVILSGSMAKGGEIFVLDMGEPVLIDNLARDLIRLSGFTPDEDIKIIYTGLLAGEKLYEELLMADEGLIPTENKKIFVSKIMDISMDELGDVIGIVERGMDDGDIAGALRKVVPTYV
jgi:FlaA1/EpsC-like NDP-sugar epimerase